MASPSTWRSLRHFSPSEFIEPALMDDGLVYWLDDVRERAGIPLVVTSSYRSPDANSRAGGFGMSLHLSGCAVDVVTKSMREAGDVPADVFKIAAAVTASTCGRRREMIIERRSGVWHVHLGLFPPSDKRPDRLTFINIGLPNV